MSEQATGRWQPLSKALGEAFLAAALEPPDNTFGWGTMLGQMWQERVRPSGLLLLGPDGCGKHTAALHMMRVVSDDEYEFAVVNDEVLARCGDVTELAGWVEEHVKTKLPLCLVLDQPSDRKKRKALLSALAVLMARSRSGGNRQLLFLICIGISGRELPSQLRTGLMRCVMTLPTAVYRQVFLQKQLQEQFQIELEDCAGEELIARTEGFTYAQLRDLAYQIGLTARMYGTEDIEPDILQLVSDQQSITEEDVPDVPQEDGLTQLAERVGSLIEMLPLLLKAVSEGADKRMQTLAESLVEAASRISVSPGGNPSVDPTPVPNPQPTPDDPLDDPIDDPNGYIKGQIKRIEQMKPSDLLRDLFAEQIANQNQQTIVQ